MHKRGVSNLEFILAFVLFAGFTVAALYFFNPVKNLKDMDYSRDYTLSKIIENTSVELDSYSIVITESAPSKMKIGGLEIVSNVSAIHYDGSIIDSSKMGDNICIDRDISGREIITLYFSKDITPFALLEICPPSDNKCECEPRYCDDCKDHFEDLPPWCPPLTPVADNLCTGITTVSTTPEDYQISSFTTDSVISENGIRRLASVYNYESYSLVKEQLNIPEDVDFSFSLKFSDTDKIVAERQLSNVTREIFTETNRVEVLRASGIPQFGELTVSVW
jgi:hypothetical protein